MYEVQIPGLSWQEYSVLRTALRTFNAGKLGENLKWALLAKVDYAASKAIGPRSPQEQAEELLIAAEYGMDDGPTVEDSFLSVREAIEAVDDGRPELEFGDFEPARYDEDGDEIVLWDTSKPGVDLILNYPWAFGPLASDV